MDRCRKSCIFVVLWEFIGYKNDFQWKKKGRLCGREYFSWDYIGGVWVGREGRVYLAEEYSIVKVWWWEVVCLYRR